MKAAQSATIDPSALVSLSSMSSQQNYDSDADRAMELPIDATEEDSWWLQEANNDTDQSDEDAFGEFKQAQPVQAA